MAYFVFFIFLLVVTQGLIPSVKKASAVIAVVFWLIIGLRDVSVGTDTIDYVTNSFLAFTDVSYSNLLRLTADRSEPLFITINWALAQLTDIYSIMLLFWALFPALAIYATLSKEVECSSDLAISYICLFMLGLFSFFVAGLRQTVAISLAFYSYVYIKKPIGWNFYRQSYFWRFVICMTFAYFIHNSILIFVLITPFIALLKKIELKWCYLVPVAVVSYYLSRMDITQLVAVSQLIFADRYEQYGENNFESSWSPSAFIMQLLIFMICFLMRRKLVVENRENILLLNLVLIGLVLQSLAGVMAEFARISYYFSIFYLILLPRAMALLSYKGKYSIVYVGFLSLSLFFLFFLSSAHLPEYKFSF